MFQKDLQKKENTQEIRRQIVSVFSTEMCSKVVSFPFKTSKILFKSNKGNVIKYEIKKL